jgi:3-dehydroquinate dehydratase/shikimate dehydrogenase
MRPGGVCVCLTPDTLDDVFAADVAGADCVEVRLDYLKEPQQAANARWDRLGLPVIATCRGSERGGRFRGSVEEELAILGQAAKNGARFVDIDYRYARPLGGADAIGSFHDFDSTPSAIDAILNRACSSAAAIAKIATSVNSWSDNRRLLDLLNRSWPKPVIVAGIGETGQVTRVVGPSRGSFLTYAAAAAPSAPGQMHFRELLDVYRFRRLRRETRLIGILGNPVEHSLSPLIHNRGFDALNLDFVYLKFPARDVKDFIDNAPAIGIEGFSVTIPHKIAVIPFLDGQSAEARETGAVNTVYRRDGGWFGDNTDVHGVRAALAAAGFDPRGKTVTILGSGGASKAAQAALKAAGRVRVLTRAELPQAPDFDCDLLINATPSGMWPAVDESPVSGPIRARAVFDMVYNPPLTRLLRAAADQGKTIIPGTSMFMAQAARQFQIWTGHEAPAEIFMGAPGEL